MNPSVIKPASLTRVSENEGRFRTLVQSPLRAGILRFFYARPEEAFDVEAIMTTFGRLRLDVDNCLKELLDFGIIARLPGEPEKYAAAEIVGRRPAAAARITSSNGARRSAWRTSRRPCSGSAK
jgi:hypothetical protein